MGRDNWETGRDRASRGGGGGGGGGESSDATPGPEAQADGVGGGEGGAQAEPGALPDDGRGGAPEASQGGSARRSGTSAAEPEPIQSDAAARLDEQRDKYLRLAAEFDNYRKRTTRERQEAGVRAQGELLKRILDSLDDLDRATSVNTAGVDVRSIVEGIRAVDQKLMRTLADAGLEVMSPVDEPFNPELHEAIATEPALSPEDDHLVSQVYQPGYVFQGQLLRPARVVVKQWSE